MAPDGVGEGAARGGEEAELTEGGLSVELHDLGVVADDGDGAAEGRGGDLGPGEVHVLPRHRVELWLAVVAVVEELPLRRDGDVGHCWSSEREWNGIGTVYSKILLRNRVREQVFFSSVNFFEGN